MSAWVGIQWDDEDPSPERHRPEAAELADVPREGETVVAVDGSRWTVVAVEWRIRGSVHVRLRPETS